MPTVVWREGGGGRDAKGVFSNAVRGLHQSKTACRHHSPRHRGYFEVFVQIDSKP